MNNEENRLPLKIISDSVTCLRLRQSLAFTDMQTQDFTFEENNEIENRLLIRPENNADGKDIALPERIGHILDTLSDLIKTQTTKNKFQRIETDCFTLDTAKLEFTSNEMTADLTEKEKEILVFLFNSLPNTVSKKDLLGKIWEYAENVETHTLETHIYRLRQKIEKDPANPKILITSDSGYRLNCNKD